MRKLILSGVVLFLVSFKMRAQDAQKPSPKELLLEIQKSKPDTNRISLQLKLGSYYLYKEGEYKNDLDSAFNFFNLAAQLSDKLHEVDWYYKALGMIANYYEEAGDLERCKRYCMRIITYYHKKGNTSKEADAWKWLGDLYNNLDKNDHWVERAEFYHRARTLYLQINKPVNAATVLGNIADGEMANKKYDLAENELLQVLAQYKAAGYKSQQFTFLQLCQLESAKGNYYRALVYASEGIKSMTASRDSSLGSALYQYMARCNYAVKKYKEALEWIRKSIAVDKDPFTYTCLLVQALVELNRTGEAGVVLSGLSQGKRQLSVEEKANLYRVTALYYEKMNHDDLAIRYNSKILEINNVKDFSERSYNVWSVIGNNEIAGIYLKRNEAIKAKKYINNAAYIFKNAKTSLDPRYLVAFYDHSYKYDVATGNYRDAVKNLELHDKLQDSLFTVDKDNKISELNITYQTAQQLQAIKDLHSQSAIEQVQLDKANLQRNITIGGILGMILVSALFYRNYKQKQASNNIITHKNELLQHLLTEKEWLLKEVHHRVKNNLHTVICLLESQAAYLQDDALKAVENGQHRIYAMSLIHQKLYQSDDIKTIDMSEYIPELVKSLEDSFDVSNRIHFKTDIAQIKLDISHAIPLGLIINEAVTNSIKYAFPDNRPGEISLSMVDDGGRIKLELADNGIGMPKIVSENESGSLGLVLMKGLSEDIDAEISFEVNGGTRIIIAFNLHPLNSTNGNLTNKKDGGIYA